MLLFGAASVALLGLNPYVRMKLTKAVKRQTAIKDRGKIFLLSNAIVFELCFLLKSTNLLYTHFFKKSKTLLREKKAGRIFATRLFLISF